MVAIAVISIALIGMVSAANYMYEKATVRGVGYKNVEMIISTQYGYAGQKLVEKEAGSGNVIIEKTELEAERQLNRDYTWNRWNCDYPTGEPYMDYINFTKEAEFEYMPVSYQTGTYDQKWIEKLCVQNYRIGAVLTEMYTHAEHLQKNTEVKTRGYGFKVTDPKTIPQGTIVWIPIGTANDWNPHHPDLWPDLSKVKTTNPNDPNYQQSDPLPFAITLPGRIDEALPINGACCTGVLEANLNSNVIGVAHIGWMSREPMAEAVVKGRHVEYGRSVEDLTGVFSIEKFIQLWGNSTCGAISVDWLPCL